MTASASEPVLAAFLKVVAAASDGDAVTRAALDGPLAPYGASRVGLYIADIEETSLVLVGLSGGDEVRRLYSTLPIDDASPNGVAYRTGAELFLSLRETSERFPLFTPATALLPDAEFEFGVLPLHHAGEPVGVLGVVFSTPVPRDWDSRSALDAVCAVTALWCAAHRSELRARATAKALTLTERQRSVLRLAGDGLTNGQIAAQLGFAESTVKADLTELYRLTGSVNRRDLLDRTRELR